MINNIMIIGSITISAFVFIFSIISITYTYTKNKYKQSELSTNPKEYHPTTETFVWLRELFDAYNFHLMQYENNFISYQTYNHHLQFINIIGDKREALELSFYDDEKGSYWESIELFKNDFKENERLVMEFIDKYFPTPKS